MTIDELLAMAVKCVKLAYDAMDTDYTADPAAVAQAAAQTAQAMMDFEMRQEFFEKSQPEGSGIIEF